MTLRTLSLVLALFVGPVLAHDDATLDAMPSPHGGQVRMAGAYHLELVLRKDVKPGQPAPVHLHLSDHGGNPVAVKGSSASATLLAPGGKVVVSLKPVGNRLEGSAVYGADPATKALVTVKFADGQTETARFEPFKPR
ncbi:hypothetical protein [Zoogloea sp.]|uniref:hypothetical protein n=1 Tax=Zoogloea sp. TaxID=49181 RepID=UPI00261940C6|nr:hypothetical protein [Zoogloea sp.]MDD3352177.1 hypothetical protein [Zoogloea sp.]